MQYQQLNAIRLNFISTIHWKFQGYFFILRNLRKYDSNHSNIEYIKSILLWCIPNKDLGYEDKIQINWKRSIGLLIYKSITVTLANDLEKVDSLCVIINCCLIFLSGPSGEMWILLFCPSFCIYTLSFMNHRTLAVLSIHMKKFIRVLE